MRKIFVVLPLALLMMACTAFAAPQYNQYNQIGVVIVGNGEFKTPDYYNIVKKVFKAQEITNIDYGKDIQNKYQKFLLNNDLIGENFTPKKKDMTEFTKACGYKKMIFLVVSNTSLDSQNNATTSQKNRVYVQLDAYLCNTFEVLAVETSSQDSKSGTSGLRARRAAFEKCLKEIVPSMKNSF